jgi:hypothetical protein
MRKNELRFARSPIGDILVSLWSIRRDFHCDYLIDGAYGDTKIKAVWALIKWLYRYGNLNELFYIRSIKYERK